MGGQIGRDIKCPLIGYLYRSFNLSPTFFPGEGGWRLASCNVNIHSTIKLKSVFFDNSIGVFHIFKNSTYILEK